jgi:MoxR-like ATPase
MNKHIKRLIEKASTVIIGKEKQIELALCSYFSSGHLLIEDIPGVGKTTLAKTLAALFSHDFKRIQFTNDLLPSDLIGTQIFNTKDQTFTFHRGPLFTQILLADELNRASPKTQSALLEAMEEKKITIEGVSHPLPRPFFVVATQNPKGQLGTYPLPESQMDRFMMKITLGPPSPEQEAKLLLQSKLYNEENIKLLEGEEEIHQEVAKEKSNITIDEKLTQYVVSLLNISRQSEQFIDLSPRAGIDLVEASKTLAYFNERDFVTPDDIQYLVPYVWGHRLISPLESSVDSEALLSDQLIKSVPVP